MLCSFFAVGIIKEALISTTQRCQTFAVLKRVFKTFAMADCDK